MPAKDKSLDNLFSVMEKELDRPVKHLRSDFKMDMDIIKEYYHILYSRNLVDDIKSDTSGSYQKLLLALIDK